MRDLSHRCTEPELMDNLNLPEEDLQQALKDISNVNKWLNGNTITINAIKKIIEEHPLKKKWTIADIGCGDGEILRIIVTELSDNNIDLNLVGIDMNPKSIELGRQLSSSYSAIKFKEKDVMELDNTSFDCDILLCTLTLHHFSTMDIPKFMKQFIQLAKVAVIVNDLQRSKLPYVLFTVFSRIFIKGRIAKHDGLVSIASAFTKKELISFSEQLKLHTYTITWKWAFRYLWLIKTI